MVVVDAVAVALVVVRIAAPPAMGRDRVDLEALAIMGRKEAERHMADGMIGEVRRHIGEPDLASRGRWIGRRRGRQAAELGERALVELVDAVGDAAL